MGPWGEERRLNHQEVRRTDDHEKIDSFDFNWEGMWNSASIGDDADHSEFFASVLDLSEDCMHIQAELEKWGLGWVLGRFLGPFGREKICHTIIF